MNIKQIRYFTSVVANGSLSAAAKDQLVTVQAVSKAIADLERELGHDLFVRESRGVCPTPFGRAFHQKAEPLSHGFKTLETFASEYYESLSQFSALQLVLIAPPFYRNEQARASIATFLQKGLGVDAAVEIAFREEGVMKLSKGECDALITIGSHMHPDTDCVPIGTVSPSVVMSPQHPLAEQHALDFYDVVKFPLLAFQSVERFNDTIAAKYRTRNYDLEFVEAQGDEARRLIMEENAVFFSVGIPSLGEIYPGTIMRLIKPDDAVAIPICLVSLKNHKSALYVSLERWLRGAFFFTGAETIGSDL